VSPFGKNLSANFLGIGWATAIQLLCVPFYVRLMGMESYALVGFYLMLLAVLQVLDLGLTPTMNREMARLSARAGQSGCMRDFARTLEIIYWVVGIVLGSIIALLAPLIATRWIRPESLSTDQVQGAITVMGVLIALQWPLSLYQGGLLGLQQQVRLNIIRVVMATLSGVGAVVVLSTTSPDVLTFFVWQAATGGLHVALTATSFWARMPRGKFPTRFNFSLLQQSAGFAKGMAGIALFAMVLVQMDKVVLSKLISLESFGYYVLAGTVANGLQLFILPIFTAVFPRFSGLFAGGEVASIRRLYHDCSQLMTTLVVPVAAVLAFFSFEILTLWTGDPDTARRTASLLTVMVVGTAINGLMHVPYALQLAHGWTSIGLALTVTQVAVFLPILLWAAAEHGALGAAWVWTLLNATYLAAGLPWTHHRLLRGEAGPWAVRDVGIPAAGALIVVAAGRALAPAPLSGGAAFTVIALVSIAAISTAALLAPGVRQGVISLIRRKHRPAYP